MSVPAMTPQQEKFSERRESPFELYKSLAVGKGSIFDLIWYEIVTLSLSGVPGIVGFGARSFFYPSIFGKCAGRPAIGRGVVVRIPKQIKIAKGALIDDYATLDVRGDDASIDMRDNVSIGRFTTIAAKGGHITLHPGVNIGSYCRVATNTKVEVGESCLIGAYCYIGPGNHQSDDSGRPLISQEMELKGGVSIGAHSWLGARVTVLDGVSIGKNCIIGAHSLVRENIPDNSVAIGVPAKIVRKNK